MAFLFYLVLFGLSNEDDSNDMPGVNEGMIPQVEHNMDDLPRHHHHHDPFMREEKQEPVICNAPHTKPHWNRKCTCEEGYFGNESTINTTGCWICKPLCHHQASCINNDTCVCSGGLVGDGINSCVPPMPKIVSIRKPSGTLTHPISINIVHNLSHYIPFESYCKFGNKTVIGMSHENSSISCLMPPDLKMQVQLSISFDGSNFSESHDFSPVNANRIVFHHIIEAAPQKRGVFDRLVFGIGIGALCMLIYSIASAKRKRRDKSEPEAPLLSSTKGSIESSTKLRKRDP